MKISKYVLLCGCFSNGISSRSRSSHQTVLDQHTFKQTRYELFLSMITISWTINFMKHIQPIKMSSVCVLLETSNVRTWYLQLNANVQQHCRRHRYHNHCRCCSLHSLPYANYKYDLFQFPAVICCLEYTLFLFELSAMEIYSNMHTINV